MRQFNVKACSAISGNQRDYWALFDSPSELANYALEHARKDSSWRTSRDAWAGGDNSLDACSK